ncbi:MAG: hypothetical protein ABFD04_04420 [Syntrophomonas sp.]
MTVTVTKHAIKRYRERTFDFSRSDKEIVKKLGEIAKTGKLICGKPNSKDNCIEIKHHGISVVAVQDGARLTVITCLGDDTYRKWVKSKGGRTFISQRSIYDDTYAWCL